METGSVYDITIEPVDMSGHYALMLIVCGILLIGGIICATVSYNNTGNNTGGGVVIGGISAALGILGLLFWGLIGLTDATDSTERDHVEQQLESSIGLTQIMTTGSSMYDGFVAIDNDGQAVRGIIKETGHDQYKVFLYDYK